MLNQADRKVLKAKLTKDIEKLNKQITKLETDIAKNDEIINNKRNKIVEFKDSHKELNDLLQNL
jgi:predicted  nucleic acid-binding Zn-ribbon protein